MTIIYVLGLFPRLGVPQVLFRSDLIPHELLQKLGLGEAWSPLIAAVPYHLAVDSDHEGPRDFPLRNQGHFP